MLLAVPANLPALDTAQNYPPPQAPSRRLKPDPARYYSFDILSRFTNFDYRETLTPPLKSTEKAWLPGILLKYSCHRGRALASFAYEYSGGDTDYDGSLQDGTPATGITGNRFTDAEVLLGYVFKKRADGTAGLTGYAGIGRRTWKRTLGVGTTSSYLETYSWNYYPVGLRADLKAGDKLSIGLDACVKVMTGGEIVIGFAGMGADDDLTLQLGGKPGYRLAAPLDYAYKDDWSFLITPWYEHSAIGRSDTGAITVGGTLYARAYEPASSTNMYGITAGFVHRFPPAR